MKVLLTGGAGYVGSACLRWLLKAGHDAIAFDDLSEGNAAAVPEERLVVGSIEDRTALEKVLSDHQIETVMHFAAVASVPDSIAQPEHYWRINVLGTKNLLDAMRAQGISTLLFSSTASTYAFDNPMPIVENARLDPQVPYGTTKLSAERMIADYGRAYDMGYTFLRYFNASGADPDGEFGEDRRQESHLIPLVLQAATGRRECVYIFGDDWDTRDGSCVRDYVHTDDLGQAHQLAMESLRPGQGRIYNVATGTGTTVWEVLRACEEVVGREIPHQVAPRREGDPAALVASSEKLRNELGWQPRHEDVKDIVASAWAWSSRYPNGYSDKVGSYPRVQRPSAPAPSPR